MYVDVDEAAVQAAYERIHELAVAESPSRAFVARSKRYVDGHWHRYKSKIDLFARPLPVVCSWITAPSTATWSRC